MTKICKHTTVAQILSKAKITLATNKEPVRILPKQSYNQEKKKHSERSQGMFKPSIMPPKETLPSEWVLNFNVQQSGVPYKLKTRYMNAASAHTCAQHELSAGASHTPHPKRHQSLPEHPCQQRWIINKAVMGNSGHI